MIKGDDIHFEWFELSMAIPKLEFHYSIHDKQETLSGSGLGVSRLVASVFQSP